MNSRDKGALGEDLAAAYLAAKGFAILSRNWRYGSLELDIVCEKNSGIIFVEVKTRCDDRYGGPAASVNSKKMRNLALAAQAWLNANGRWESPCRFDVICITGSRGNFALEHYADAFDISQALDHCDSAWQS